MPMISSCLPRRVRIAHDDVRPVAHAHDVGGVDGALAAARHDRRSAGQRSRIRGGRGHWISGRGRCGSRLLEALDAEGLALECLDEGHKLSSP